MSAIGPYGLSIVARMLARDRLDLRRRQVSPKVVLQ